MSSFFSARYNLKRCLQSFSKRFGYSFDEPEAVDGQAYEVITNQGDYAVCICAGEGPGKKWLRADDRFSEQVKPIMYKKIES